MRTSILTLTAILLLLSFSSVDAQQNNRRSDSIYDIKQSDYFINLSTNGFGAGYKRHLPYKNEDTKLSFGIMIASMSSDKQAQVWIPNYGYAVSGRQFYTFTVPMIVGIKKRLFREVIEDSFRTFLVAEAGPVYGVAFPTKDPFSENIKNGNHAFSFRAFAGLAVEFGKMDDRAFGITLGTHYLEFPENLGEKKDYNGIDIRINFITYIYK